MVSRSKFEDLRVMVAALSERIVGLDRLTDEKFVKFRTLIDSQAEKVALALNSADKAITKQETSYNERFTLLNELRSGVATAEQLDALEKVLTTLVSRLDRLEAHKAGSANTWGLFAGAITLIVIVVNAAFYVLG